MIFRYFLSVLMIAITFIARTQSLTPGFNAEEYLEMIRVSNKQYDPIFPSAVVDAPKNFTMVYRSPVMGLSNRWDLWLNENSSVMVVSLRGTVNETPSWLENFYCAMIPAQGKLQLNDSTVVEYYFSSDSKAAVHTGWTIGILSMLPDITEKIKTYYAKGVKQLIIMGHSQGGALAYLLHSSLYYDIQNNKLPQDITIKTYCSAAPKPGNLYYAYDFNFITRGGWAFSVVNTADWVPETPFSIQNVEDFNPLNPFKDIKPGLKKSSFFTKVYLKNAYNKLNGSSRDARKNFEKYLGEDIYGIIKKHLPQYKQPVYYPSMNYMPAGTPIPLQTDAAYYEKYPDTSKRVFTHHLPEPYYWLVEKHYGNK